MKANWKAILAAMAIVGMVGLQPQVALGEDASGSTIHKKAESLVSEQDATGNAVNKKAELMAAENGVAEKKVETAEQGKTVLETKTADTAVQRKVTVGTVTLDLMPNHVAEEMAVRKFLQEKKASFVEGDEESLELVGTSYTANRIPQLVITDTFVNALKEEAKARVEAKQREPWVFPDVDVLKEKLEAIHKKYSTDRTTKDEVESDDMKGVDIDEDSVGATSDGVGPMPNSSAQATSKDRPTEAKAVLGNAGSKELKSEGTVTDEERNADVSTEKSKIDTPKVAKDSTVEGKRAHTIDDGTKTSAKAIKAEKQNKSPKYPIDILWTDKDTIFLHEDVHVGATRSEVLFAWGAPQAMWRDNKDGSLLWLYRGVFGEEKTITKNKKSSMQKEEFSHSVKNTYTSDSLAGSNSSVGYVWLSLKQGKVTHLGMITGQDWPRFAIPATTLETFKPNTMTESDFSLMGYRLGDTFTNDPNRSWEERGKLYGQEFLGYKDVVIAYNKEHEITRVMINSSLGTTKRGISLGDSKYLLLYLYGVPDFEEPANHHDSTKGVVYGYRHPVLEHTYLLFTLDDKFIREILLSNQKKSELVSAMKSMAL
ncbi:hypothetical protein [Veillonella sp. 3310]|uniref:hypothetical protein n=1 Tax=Veillonella sp. 3310 TaxID=2490956 RepID=UPI000FD643D4|nr:hypothetical protein [Veillonella sp. 3310]